MDPSGAEDPIHPTASGGPITSEEPAASQGSPVPDTSLPHTESGEPPAPNPSAPSTGSENPLLPPADMSPTGPNVTTLNIDDKMLETVNERKQQAKAKGAIARARLRLQRPQNDAQSTTHEESINPNEVDWAAEAENAPADEDSGNFEAVKRWFEALKRPTMEQKVQYEAAKREEDIRQKRLLSREQLEQELSDQPVDNELLCPQDDTAATSHKRPHGQTTAAGHSNG
ncbi:hypothetical protein VTN77DRAFT_9048 [Rasamsonia byssochlamydoides]|uniref:uncharacterized protein n=1 Tax=Rasamsonia byssochlamydoides TaxID=89139 RepID=UPI0037434A42